MRSRTLPPNSPSLAKTRVRDNARRSQTAARSRPLPPDWVYVNNFKDPYQPNALKLPAGRGRTFQREVRAFVDLAKSGLQQAFESEEYEARKAEVQADTGKR